MATKGPTLTMVNATLFLPGLSPVAGKSLTAARDAGNLTSNGGVIVLREVARWIYQVSSP